MKFIKYITIISTLTSLAVSKDSVEVRENIRQTKPFFVLVNGNGFGFGYSIHKNIDLQVTSLFLISGADIKVYLTDNNSTPFVGAGIGKKIEGFGGNGEFNDWTVLFLGWHYHPFAARGLFVSVLYQYAVVNENTKAEVPRMFSFNIGIRLF